MSRAKKQKTKTEKPRYQKRGRSKGRPHKTRIIGVIAALGIIIGLVYAWPRLMPTPDVVRPLNPDDLDPAVAEFIAPKIKAVEDSPRDASVRADLALAYEANALWKEAQDTYEQAIQLGETSVDVRLHHALATRQAGEFDKALALLEALAEDGKPSAALMHRLAEGLLETGQIDRAEAAYRRLIELNGSAVQGHVGLADVLLQRQQADAVIPTLEEVIRREPGYKKAHYLLGRAYTMVGRTEDAEVALARGAEGNTVFIPDPLSQKLASYAVNVTGQLDQAMAYLEAGQPQQAAAILEKTYRFHASHTMVLNTLATAYLRTNRLDDAHRLLLRARELEEDQFFTYLNLYQWALRKKNIDQALEFADVAIEKAPDRDDTHLARAQALTALGRHEEALVSADKARELDGTKPPNHALSGEICFQLADFSAAESHFMRAVALQPGYLPAWVGLTRSRMSLGLTDRARESLEQARAIAPTHPAVQQLLIEIAGQ